MFPQGGPGIALFLLRTSVAVIFFMNAAKLVNGSSVQLLLAGIALISISLAAGFLTPYLSVMACVAAAAHLLIGSSSSNLIYVFEICDAAASTVCNSTSRIAGSNAMRPSEGPNWLPASLSVTRFNHNFARVLAFQRCGQADFVTGAQSVTCRVNSSRSAATTKQPGR